MRKKILLVCPIVPYPEHGAEQSDRANGIRQLIRIGFDVRVIAKRRPYQSDSTVKAFSDGVGGIPVKTVFYKYTISGKSFIQKLLIVFKRILHLSYLDGAAFEYSDKEIQDMVKKEIEEWSPDILWFEYTYLWPIYPIAKKKNIPIVTRSINYEPQHFLDEDGRSVLNYIKVLPKYISEKKVIRLSNLICAITPAEAETYRKLGAKNVIVLPLRGLYGLPEHRARDKDITKIEPFNLFFMGSTYNVAPQVLI